MATMLGNHQTLSVVAVSSVQKAGTYRESRWIAPVPIGGEEDSVTSADPMSGTIVCARCARHRLRNHTRLRGCSSAPASATAAH